MATQRKRRAVQGRWPEPGTTFEQAEIDLLAAAHGRGVADARAEAARRGPLPRSPSRVPSAPSGD